MATKLKGVDTVTGKDVLVATTVQWAQETPSGTVNGVNTDFVLTNTPTSLSGMLVFRDSIIVRNSEYSVNVGTKTITFSVAPASGQDIYVMYPI